MTTTIGVVHQFSPQLTISASVGGFWSDIDYRGKTMLGARHARPVRQRVVPVPTDAPLYGLYGGRSATRSPSARSSPPASPKARAERLRCLSKSDSAGASLTHQFSDRLTGRLGAGYTRTIFPATCLDSSSNDNYYSGRGRRFLPARGTLESSTRDIDIRAPNMRRRSASQPRIVGFVSIGYNWPGHRSPIGWAEALGDARSAGSRTPFTSRLARAWSPSAQSVRVRIARDVRRSIRSRIP